MINRIKIEKQHKIVREAIQDLFDTWNNSFSDDDMVILGGILQDVQRVMKKAIKQLSKPVEGQKQKKHSTGSWDNLIEQLLKIGRSGKQFGQSTLVTNAFRLASKNGSSVKYEHPDYVCFSRKAWKEQRKAAKKAVDQAYEKGLKDKEKDYNEEWANVAYKTKWFNDLVEKQIDKAVKERDKKWTKIIDKIKQSLFEKNDSKRMIIFKDLIKMSEYLKD